jgi:hypothetical protein
MFRIKLRKRKFRNDLDDQDFMLATVHTYFSKSEIIKIYFLAVFQYLL